MSENSMVEFPQIDWNQAVAKQATLLVQMALEEDFADQRDWTTWSTIPQDSTGVARFVCRQPGIVAGLPIVDLIMSEMQRSGIMDGDLIWSSKATDGDQVEKGTVLGELSGSTRSLLQMERTTLNFLGRLSGIATLTHQFVESVKGTGAGIYDTRKTTPGWRLLEKYAVRCGGGRNHRLGLYAAVMLKDNHLAADDGDAGVRLVNKVKHAQSQLAAARQAGELSRDLIFEVEVDSLQQLEALLDLDIDIILLDNMGPETLRQAVVMRDQRQPKIQLEASGGVQLSTVRAIAESGVERISSGSLTHSAVNWDIGLDWVD